MRPCLSVYGATVILRRSALSLEIASTAGMSMHIRPVQVLRTEVWAGVCLSKLSAKVHEYEGGLGGARPCVGPGMCVRRAARDSGCTI